MFMWYYEKLRKTALNVRTRFEMRLATHRVTKIGDKVKRPRYDSERESEWQQDFLRCKG